MRNSATIRYDTRCVPKEYQLTIALSKTERHGTEFLILSLKWIEVYLRVSRRACVYLSFISFFSFCLEKMDFHVRLECCSWTIGLKQLMQKCYKRSCLSFCKYVKIPFPIQFSSNRHSSWQTIWYSVCIGVNCSSKRNEKYNVKNSFFL